MAKGAFLFNLMARRYSRTPIANKQAYEHKLERTRKYLSPESEVFEIGCGTGSTALLHAPFVKHIHATDYAYKMIEIANEKKAADNVDNASFEVATIEDMDPEANKYDVVLALNIIHILEDKPAALAKAYAMLKPGGYFISSTPCIEKIAFGWRMLITIFRLIGFPKLESMSVDQLKKMMVEAGFKEEEAWIPEGEMVSIFLVASKPT